MLNAHLLGVNIQIDTTKKKLERENRDLSINGKYSLTKLAPSHGTMMYSVTIVILYKVSKRDSCDILVDFFSSL